MIVCHRFYQRFKVMSSRGTPPSYPSWVEPGTLAIAVRNTHQQFNNHDPHHLQPHPLCTLVEFPGISVMRNDENPLPRYHLDAAMSCMPQEWASLTTATWWSAGLWWATPRSRQGHTNVRHGVSNLWHEHSSLPMICSTERAKRNQHFRRFRWWMIRTSNWWRCKVGSRVTMLCDGGWGTSDWIIIPDYFHQALKFLKQRIVWENPMQRLVIWLGNSKSSWRQSSLLRPGSRIGSSQVEWVVWMLALKCWTWWTQSVQPMA